MFACFTDRPTSRPTPPSAQIDLNAMNLATAYGAERSRKMDFTEYDKVDDFELNEILWRSIKGTTPRCRRPSAGRSPIGPHRDRDESRSVRCR